MIREPRAELCSTRGSVIAMLGLGVRQWVVCAALACAACNSSPPIAFKKQQGNIPVGGAASAPGGAGSGSFGGSGSANLDAGGRFVDVDGGVLIDGSFVEVAGPGTVVPEPTDDSAFLWDDAQPPRTFELTVAQADLDKINADPSAEQFVPASFKLGGETITNAAARYKGSIGAFVNCTTSGGLMPSGAKTCAKLSMKVAFDWADSTQRFHGLKKLNFHSMNEDASLMRDRLGYAMFREAGIAAPRCVHARLMINGKFAGLFALVEEIDGRFTDTRFTALGDGNLYKEIWPKWTVPETYRPALRTRQNDPTVSFERVARFAQGVVDAPDDASVNLLSTQWMDMTYVMNFIAADRTVLNDDGIFHWYCSGGSLPTGNNPGPCSSHNYYWYEEAHWDRLWLIEWDITLAFRGETSGFIQVLDEWNTPNPTCTQKASLNPLAPPQMPAACDKLTHGWGAQSAEYKAAVRRFLDGPYAANNVDAKLTAWTSQISSVVTEAANAGQSPSAVVWQSALSSLRTTVSDLRAAAEMRTQ